MNHFGNVQPAIENLTNNQIQADMDGCMVTVSRQALDEVLTAIESLTASPGEQEPVAYEFRQRSGIGSGPQSQSQWCDWCSIGREDYERYCREPNKLIQVRALYTSAPPAAGWNEAIEAATLICRDAITRTGSFSSRTAMAEEMAAAIAALRREAPAPERVAKFGGTALCGHGVMASICERCRYLGLTVKTNASRPNAGGGVRGAIEDLRVQSEMAYCRYIEQMSKPECLGFEAKLLSGKFSKAELDARSRAGELLGKHQALSDAVKYLESALSTPPAAVESNGSAESDGAMCPHPIETLWRKVGLPEFFLGNGGTNHNLYALYDAIRSTAPNASVETRLREALTPSAATKAAYIGEFHFFVDDRDEDGEECTRMVTVPWTTTKEIMKAILDHALSAVGDEAKKSEGGSRKQPFDPADAAGVKSGTVTFDGQTGRPNRDEVGASQTPGSSMSFAADKPIVAEQALRPSDPTASAYGEYTPITVRASTTLSSPTAERREIVARALMEKWPGDYAWGDETREPNELAFETADAILAALDGGR